MKLMMILAPGFEEFEAIGTADILKRLGQEVHTAGLGGKKVLGAHGIAVETDEEFVDGTEYDGVILPGGLPGATNLLQSNAVLECVREFHEAGKLIAAICAAPIVLARLGILRDRKFTMYPGFDRYLGGLRYTDNKTETDGNVITGKGPGAVFAFAAAIAKAAGSGNQVPELYAGMFVDGE